jgi:hypothetical protein
VEKLSQTLSVCRLDWLDPEVNHAVAVSVTGLLTSVLLVL